MSGVRGRDGKRITHTVAYFLKCPASSAPQAMRVCKYSNKESSNMAKQMAVCQAWKAALKKKKKSPPPPVESAHCPWRRLCHDGSALQALVLIKPTETEPRRLTERNSNERIALLARANMHGKKFFVTG